MEHEQTNDEPGTPDQGPASRSIAYATLDSRKAAQAERLKRNAQLVLAALTDYAREKGGKFVVFGSFSTQQIRFDSDLDVMIDFPTEKTSDAWRFVEDVCARLSVPADIHDAHSTKPEFSERVRKTGLILE